VFLLYNQLGIILQGSTPPTHYWCILGWYNNPFISGSYPPGSRTSIYAKIYKKEKIFNERWLF
jgi:hypothetical protein